MVKPPLLPPEPAVPEMKRRIFLARPVKTIAHPFLDLVWEISTLSENTRT
jgi:hypothetical protein